MPLATCAVCNELVNTPVTFHMRNAHPGCGGPAEGHGYDSSGKLATDWHGNCGSGGMPGTTTGWYLLCKTCRHKYQNTTNQHAESAESNPKLKSIIEEQAKQIRIIQSENEKLSTALAESSEREKAGLNTIKDLKSEIEQMKISCEHMENMLREAKLGALESVKRSLKFVQLENLSKPLICIQLENGTTIYFDNVKPFELFIVKDGSHIKADLKLLEGEFDCSFRGTIGNIAYFCTTRGKIVKFFSTFVEDDQLRIEQINEMKTAEISLFNNQPFYLIELAKKWSIYQYNEDHTEKDGENFDISEINHLSKYERRYHRGILYLFREHSQAAIEKVNDKIVIIEGPLLDPYESSIYTPQHSDFIYILNKEHNLLIVLNTTNLTVSQTTYEPPADSNNHSIVGIKEGILTMAFDGVWGRHLATSSIS